LNALEDLTLVEVLLCHSPTLFTHDKRLLPIVQEIRDCCGKSFHIPNRNENSVSALLNRFSTASDVSDNTRHSHG
jgi:hypothetical protein